MDTLERNRQAFSGQSQGFSSEGDTYADAEGLAWMLEDLPLSREAVCLDIATGTGEFARALAPEVASVIGLDATDAMLEQGRHFGHMNGSMVFKHATRRFCEAIKEVLDKGGVSIDEVALVIPHQANQRITDAVGARMGLPREKVFSNIAKYGNTTAASIPIALAEAVREGRLQRSDLLVTVAFGSGFTWGANLIRW